MDPAPRPSLREWIVIVVLFLIFFWIPMLFVGAELSHHCYLFLEKFPDVRIHEAKARMFFLETEKAAADGRPYWHDVILYWHEDNRHTNVYCDVYAQDENGFRAATYSEFVTLENYLRPH